MQKNQFNLIGEEELQKINREIVHLFGIQSAITSGSYCICKGNEVQYYITVGDTSTYNSSAKVRRIGERVKEMMGVHEVYSLGIKLA